MTTNPPPDDGHAPPELDAQENPLDPAAAAVLERASAVLDRASTELAASTDRDPSPGLLPAVMETVWAELRPGQQIPLPGSGGTLLVTETAVGNALVAHLDGLPELLVRRCVVRYEAPADAPAQDSETTGAEPGGVGQTADSADETVHVALTAAVAYGTATDQLVQRIRSVITLAAEQLFGLTVSSVDVDIVDVYPAPGVPQ